jgi:hypothetical protein
MDDSIRADNVDLPGLLIQCRSDNDRYDKLKSAYQEKIRQYTTENKKKIRELTNDEEFLIAHYVGSAYNWVNDDLRNGIDFPTDCRKLYSRYLDISLEKIASFSGTAYRMDDPSDEVDKVLKWFDLNKGKVIVVPNYLSTSKDKWDHHKSIVWTIETLPTNSYAKDISMISEIEEEVLFKRNSKFVINGVDFQSKEVSLKEVPANTEQDLVLVRQYIRD